MGVVGWRALGLSFAASSGLTVGFCGTVLLSGGGMGNRKELWVERVCILDLCQIC